MAVIAYKETGMGRKRKALRLHRVKGYYSTYSVGTKTRYKYFGTQDPEKAYRAYRKWAERERQAELAGKTRAEFDLEGIRRRMKNRKLHARFILSLPDDFSGGPGRMEKLFKQWLHEKRKGRT